MSTKQNADTFPYENLSPVVLTGSEVSVTFPGQPLKSVTIIADAVITYAWKTTGPKFELPSGTPITFDNKNLGGISIFLDGTANVYVMYEHGTGS